MPPYDCEQIYLGCKYHTFSIKLRMCQVAFFTSINKENIQFAKRTIFVFRLDEKQTDTDTVVERKERILQSEILLRSTLKCERTCKQRAKSNIK